MTQYSNPDKETLETIVQGFLTTINDKPKEVFILENRVDNSLNLVIKVPLE